MLRLLGLAALTLAIAAATCTAGAFPGTNGKLAYIKAGQVWTVNPDGSGAKRLDPSGVGSAENPVWSADGTQIAFVSRYGEIVVANADGSGAKAITQIPQDEGRACDHWPAWSPDGTQIAFSTTENGCGGAGYSVLVMNIDGTKRKRIDPRGMDILGGDTQAAWSPDGGKILFARSESLRMASGPYVYDLFTLDVNTHRVTRLTRDDHSSDGVWSPDGKSIAFRETKGGNSEIYVMSAAGKKVTRVTSGGSNYSPGWSPDGRSILYVHGEHAVGDLYTVHPDGTAKHLAVKCSCTTPDWQART